jgi:hypothetical protein
MHTLPDTHLHVTADPPAGGIAARLVRNDAPELRITVHGIANLLAYHAHLERTEGPLPIVAAQQRLAASLRLYPQLTVIDAAPVPAVPADLTSAERLADLDDVALEQLHQTLLAHLVRLRAWQRCAGEPRRPLLVEASVTSFADISYTCYLLSVDQPWPEPLEGFRDQFVGAHHSQPVHLTYSDERYLVEIHPLDARSFD